jgi:anti-anti-sigma factor
MRTSNRKSRQKENLRTLTEFTCPSAPGNEHRVIERVVDAVNELNLPDTCIERLKTAVSEATINAMEHGNHYQEELPVEVRVRVSEHSLEVDITDQGGGQAILETEDPDLEAKLEGEQSPRGWGLFLIKNMVDQMRVITDKKHHTIELILYLNSGSLLRDGQIKRTSGERNMSKVNVMMNVRKLEKNASVIDIQGEINAFAENALMDAYTQATSQGARVVILDFSKLEYMNSSGIGLLVTLLIRVRRQNQRLLACGLNEHYRQIFELTRLNEAIVIYPSVDEALKSVQAVAG